MRALIDKFTGKIMCPACLEAKFKVVNKTGEEGNKIICHARCSSCCQEFVFVKDGKGKLI